MRLAEGTERSGIGVFVIVRSDSGQKRFVMVRFGTLLAWNGVIVGV